MSSGLDVCYKKPPVKSPGLRLQLSPPLTTLLGSPRELSSPGSAGPLSAREARRRQRTHPKTPNVLSNTRNAAVTEMEAAEHMLRVAEIERELRAQTDQFLANARELLLERSCNSIVADSHGQSSAREQNSPTPDPTGMVRCLSGPESGESEGEGKVKVGHGDKGNASAEAERGDSILVAAQPEPARQAQPQGGECGKVVADGEGIEGGGTDGLALVANVEPLPHASAPQPNQRMKRLDLSNAGSIYGCAGTEGSPRRADVAAVVLPSTGGSRTRSIRSGGGRRSDGRRGSIFTAFRRSSHSQSPAGSATSMVSPPLSPDAAAASARARARWRAALRKVRLVLPGELVHVPARKVLAELRFLEGVKGFLFFTLFFVAFFTLNWVRIDWEYGHSTLRWWAKALESTGVRKFEDATAAGELGTFINISLSLVIGDFRRRCVGCLVAATPQRRDMRGMGIADFICTDFDSMENTRRYPARDCDAADAQFVASPSAARAPCCRNWQLVSWSLLLMAQEEGIRPRFNATALWDAGGPSLNATVARRLGFVADAAAAPSTIGRFGRIGDRVGGRAGDGEGRRMEEGEANTEAGEAGSTGPANAEAGEAGSTGPANAEEGETPLWGSGSLTTEQVDAEERLIMKERVAARQQVAHIRQVAHVRQAAHRASLPLFYTTLSATPALADLTLPASASSEPHRHRRSSWSCGMILSSSM